MHTPTVIIRQQLFSRIISPGAEVYLNVLNNMDGRETSRRAESVHVKILYLLSEQRASSIILSLQLEADTANTTAPKKPDGMHLAHTTRK